MGENDLRVDNKKKIDVDFVGSNVVIPSIAFPKNEKLLVYWDGSDCYAIPHQYPVKVTNDFDLSNVVFSLNYDAKDNGYISRLRNESDLKVTVSINPNTWFLSGDILSVYSTFYLTCDSDITIDEIVETEDIHHSIEHDGQTVVSFEKLDNVKITDENGNYLSNDVISGGIKFYHEKVCQELLKKVGKIEY